MKPTMRAPSFGMPSRDQITCLDLRERCAGVCCCLLTHTNTIPHCTCLSVADSCVEGRAQKEVREDAVRGRGGEKAGSR